MWQLVKQPQMLSYICFLNSLHEMVAMLFMVSGLMKINSLVFLQWVNSQENAVRKWMSVFRAQFEQCAVNKLWSSTLNNEKEMVFQISAHFKKILFFLYLDWSSGPVEKYHYDHVCKYYIQISLLLNNKLKRKTSQNFIMKHHAERYRVHHQCLNLYFLHTDFSHLSYFQK